LHQLVEIPIPTFNFIENNIDHELNLVEEIPSNTIHAENIDYQREENNVAQVLTNDHDNLNHEGNLFTNFISIV
jgi:hypothetical protein